MYVMNEGNVEFQTHIIDDNSAPHAIWFEDFNKDGKIDIVTSNKTGTRIFIA